MGLLALQGIAPEDKEADPNKLLHEMRPQEHNHLHKGARRKLQAKKATCGNSYKHGAPEKAAFGQ